MSIQQTMTSITKTVVKVAPKRIFIVSGAVGLVTLAIVDPPRFRKYVTRPIQRTLGKLFTVVGFIGNFAMDVLSPGSSSKHKQWKQIMSDLNVYLERTGLYDEFGTDVPKHLARHVLIMNQIQHRHYSRKASSSMRTSSSLSSLTIPSIQLAEHYMKFATAVYGADVIMSAQLELDDFDLERSLNVEDMSTEYAIAQHTGIDAKTDVLVADVESGESTEYLRHMVVIDHSTKSIILAIRGTFSVTGILVDLAAFSETFCGGQAHSGMAKMAKAVWAKVERHILMDENAMKRLPDGYDLVVTGHSLGAGVACLITILLYHLKATDPKIAKRLPKKIRCMAYAPPPVFYPQSAAKKAVENTVAYVHNMDCVPSLSVYAVRRLLKTMNDLHIPLQAIPHQQTFPGMKLLPETLVEAMAKSTLEPMTVKEGAEPLSVPAHSLIWLQLLKIEDGSEEKKRNNDTDGDGCYTTMVLDPLLYSERVIDVHSRMIADHMQPQYEKAFRVLATAEQEKIDTI